MSSYSYRVTPYYATPPAGPNLFRTFACAVESGLGVGRPATLPVGWLGIIANVFDLSVEQLPALNAPNVQIVSQEYMGDGTSSRQFDVPQYTPVVVLVVGKDGSGNTVGAIKLADMPSGKSQPLQNVSAADSARSNRILDILPNAFTVGSDLNVTGRSYTWIAFPSVPGSLHIGTYTGSGSGGTLNTSINAGSGQVNAVGGTDFTVASDSDPTWKRPSGSTVYAPGVPLITAGRRLIRNSDGAVIAEATSYNNNQSIQAVVYIAGFFIGNSYHWEENYIDLGGMRGPDTLWLIAEDTATGKLPGLFVPGIIADSVNSTTAQDFLGNGLNPSPAALPVDDTSLHVAESYNVKSATYHWIAFKAAELLTGFPLAKFAYTGTGALGTPPNLQGLDFAPGFVLGARSADTYRFAKDGSSVVTSGKTRVLWDGQGEDAATDVTFQSDGISITAGSDWNGGGVDYVILQFQLSSPLVVRRFTAVLEALKGLAEGFDMPVAAGGIVSQDFDAPIDWTATILRQYLLPYSSGIGVLRPFDLSYYFDGLLVHKFDCPVEGAGFLLRDSTLPIEVRGGLIRSLDFPCENRQGLVRVFERMWYAYRVMVRHHFSLPYEWLQAVAAPGLPYEILQGMGGLFDLPIDVGRGVSGQFDLPVESSVGVSRLYELPVGWEGAIAQAFDLPIDVVGFLIRRYGCPIDVTQVTEALARRYLLPYESGLGVAGRYDCPVEWTAVVALTPSIPAGGGRLTTTRGLRRERRAVLAPARARVPFMLRVEVGGSATVVVRLLRTAAEWDRLDLQDLEEL